MKAVHISETVPCGMLLSLSGGCMDAYSYMFRGKVFANAQTGNILLFGVNLAGGELTAAVKYLWPVLLFSAGIVFSDIISNKRAFLLNHWKQVSVLFEAVILIIVAFVPESLNPVANMLISFACGIQVESFRKINDNNIATTMCIGNLRSGLSGLGSYISTHDRTYLKKSALYFGTIGAFVIGAVIETVLVIAIGTYAILLSAALLVLTLVFMSHSEETASDAGSM